MSRRRFVPARPQAVRISRKAQDGEHGKCPHCQEKLRVSQPGDALEHEADRAADAVMNRATPTTLGSMAGLFQRDPVDDVAKPQQPDNQSHTLGTGLGKVAEAAAQTPAGKKALAKAGEEAKKVLSDPAGATAVGVLAGGTVAGLAAANQKLPFQPPAIPLGDSGYKAGLRYEGPLRTPSYVGLTFGGTLPGEPKPKKHKEDPGAYRAETARMRAELEQWKPREPADTVPAGALAPLAKPPASVHQAAPPPQPPRKKETAPAVQRKARSAGVVAQPVFEALDESGDALDANTRQFMEQRFRRDFSAVRIHSGRRGAKAADALNAHAFAYGEHVGFASGEYRPGTESGRRLLAHELAHVAQQGAAPLQAATSASVTRHPDTSPAAPPISTTPTPALARASKPPKGAVTVTLGSANELNNLKFKVWPEDSKDPEVKGLKCFNVDGLVLPATKGPNALAVYKRYADGGALSSTVRVAGDAQASMWQERAGTDQLKSRWLDMRGWPSGKAADKYWEKAGGDAQFPRVNNAACQMDHIVELQLGGNNTNENIQTLDATKNGASGRTLWAEMSGLARAISESNELETTGAAQIRMNFIKVDMQGPPEKLPASCKGVQSSCLAVESCANKIKLDKADIHTDGTEPYELNTEGGHQTQVNVPLGFAKKGSAEPVSFEESGNKAAATLIPGFVLKTLKHAPGKTKGNDHVDASIDTETKTRLPLAFGTDKSGKSPKSAKKGDDDAAPVKLEVQPPKNTLKLAKGSVHIPFYYPYLSPGVITTLTPTPDGVDFVGSITPSVPFLGKLDIAYVKGALSITKGLDPKDIRLPLKDAKITKAALGIELAPELKAKGELGFEYKPSGKKLLDAELTASADTSGLKLAGNVHAYLPGVDSAEGHLEYSTSGGWSGGAKATANDLKKKFKYVTGGEVSIGIKGGDKHGRIGVDAAGTVNLDLPHTKGVSATLENRGGRWLFRGKGTFEVPRLKPVDIEIEYDGTHLSGEARNIGFKYKSFDASIDIKYRDEKFSGSGKLAFEKGRAKGTLQINLLPNEHFTGKGNVTLQIKEGLEATAGVELDENEKLHVAGKLAFTKPIKLFDGFGGDATIFKAGVSIPIPGASIGPIGVKARIEGELSAGYHIGPGEIRNASAEAHFDPLEENPNFEFEIGGQLWIGASAHITGAVTGSIVLDAVIAEVSGGLTVSATASLNGEVLSNVKFSYTKERYALTADFAASLALAIRLALEASVHAQAGIGPFKVETEKRWTLAAKEFNTGLKLGISVKKPLSYSSDKGLEIPGASDIEVTKPDLDPSRLLKDVFGASAGKEREV